MSDTSREALGRLVRETWVAAVKELIPDPKPSWVAPWGELDGFQREVDMRIGEAVAAAERERQRTSHNSPCRRHGDLDCNDFACVEVAEAVAAEREHVATQVEAYAANYPEDLFPPASDSRDAISGRAMCHAYRNAAALIREETTHA